MKDLGILTQYVGTEVCYNNENVELKQTEYLKRILERFNMNECKSMSTPMDRDVNVKEFCEKCVDIEMENMIRQIWRFVLLNIVIESLSMWEK